MGGRAWQRVDREVIFDTPPPFNHKFLNPHSTLAYRASATAKSSKRWMLISDFKLHRKNGTQWQRMQKRQEGECFLICKFLTNLSVIKSIIQEKNRSVNNKDIMIGTEIRRKSRIKQIWVEYVDQNTQTRLITSIQSIQSYTIQWSLNCLFSEAYITKWLTGNQYQFNRIKHIGIMRKVNKTLMNSSFKH